MNARAPLVTSSAGETLRPMGDGEHVRVVAVIQARMGSTRLPGKVLKPVAGKPLLWHIVHRLKSSRLIEDIAIATTTNPLDEAIVEFGASEGVTVIRGPEDDVLARFALAAEAMDADVIVRVSSDAPFIDAAFVDHLIATLIEQEGDYVLIQEGGECAHEGVDPFSRRALDKLMMDAANDPAAREHVTGYFKLHPDFVKVVRAAPWPALKPPTSSWRCSTPACCPSGMARRGGWLTATRWSCSTRPTLPPRNCLTIWRGIGWWRCRPAPVMASMPCWRRWRKRWRRVMR